jgi:hypothetical protein
MVSTLKRKVTKATMDTPIVVVLELARVLEEMGITYAVVGSLASSFHGMYRASGDIDILADITRPDVRRFKARLETDFYVDDLMMRDAIANRSKFNVIHFDSVFKVDIFLPNASGFDANQLKRRVQARLTPDLEQTIYLTSAEDTVLAKLCWYRKGHEISELQWRDVIGILGTAAAKLDDDYLRSWADALSVADLLERALSEST